MRILVFAAYNEFTTAAHIIQALRKTGHHVLVCSTQPGTEVDCLCGDSVRARPILERMQFAPEVLLCIEASADLVPRDVAELGIPTIWYGMDAHLHLSKHAALARIFDVAFLSHKYCVEELRGRGLANVEWLPVAANLSLCEPGSHEKRFQVAFVGTLDPRLHPERVALLETIRRNFSPVFIGQAFLEDMAKIYQSARIVFNKSIRGDMNMRVFEALASGSLLVTDRLDDPGFNELFRDGEHLITYQNEREMVEKTRYYLEHPAEAEKISANGYRLVRERHTYEHRAKAIVQAAQGLLDQTRLRVIPRPGDVVYASYLANNTPAFLEMVRELVEKKDVQGPLSWLVQAWIVATLKLSGFILGCRTVLRRRLRRNL